MVIKLDGRRKYLQGRRGMLTCDLFEVANLVNYHYDAEQNF